MEIRGTTRLIALIGDPVSHSLSPAMHNAAFAHHGLDFAYIPLRVHADNIKTALDALRACHFRGANVTLPHKQAVIPFLDGLSDLSRLMGAVNTIVNDDGRLIGTTTDPHGFLEGFRAAGHSFTDRSVAILGNGGSARTLAFALLTQDKPARVVIVGRDVAKSRRLADEIGQALAHRDQGKDAAAGSIPLPEATSLASYPGIAGDIQVVVNATPLGMHPDTESSPLDPGCLRPGQIVYDIVYVPERTRLIRDAEARGLGTVGGLGMLVHQGLTSFRLWTGVAPEASLFYRSAREELARRSEKPA